MIRDSELELKRVRHIAEIGGYKDKATAQDMITLAEKDLDLTKGEIEFSEYWQAYLKVYGKKVV
jgi:hypothetical protein